jgi:hypothetical protein
MVLRIGYIIWQAGIMTAVRRGDFLFVYIRGSATTSKTGMNITTTDWIGFMHFVEKNNTDVAHL